MIIFEMESPSIIGGVFYILFSVCAFLAIIYSLYKSVDYIKERYGPYKTYPFIAIVFFTALISLPVGGIVSFKTESDIWKRYSDKEYKEFNGKFLSMKYGTSGVRLFFLNGNDFYVSSRERYCFSFAFDDGYDEAKEVYIRYIGFGEGDNSAQCVVYAEQ
jgi:hypothetical protein